MDGEGYGGWERQSRKQDGLVESSAPQSSVILVPQVYMYMHQASSRMDMVVALAPRPNLLKRIHIKCTVTNGTNKGKVMMKLSKMGTF